MGPCAHCAPYCQVRACASPAASTVRPLDAAASTDLFALTESLAEDLNIGPLTAASVGGASDGNFTAGLGVATLDGLGAVGGGAHADTEHVVVAELTPRTQLLTALARTLLARHHRAGEAGQPARVPSESPAYPRARGDTVTKLTADTPSAPCPHCNTRRTSDAAAAASASRVTGP